MPLKQCSTSKENKKRAKKHAKKANPLREEEEINKMLYEPQVPLKKPNKHQKWDKDAHLKYTEYSAATKQGKPATMLALGLDLIKMSPYPNLEFTDDENVMKSDTREAAALKLAQP